MSKQAKLNLGIPETVKEPDHDAVPPDNKEDRKDGDLKEGEIYSVSGLTKYIKRVLEHEPNLKDIWIRGEISNLTNHTSGHKYFTLKDEGSALSCIMFRGTGGRLRFGLEHGLNVLAHGHIGVYQAHGKYQLVVDNIKPDGLGTLHQAYLQLKEKLEKEGLFDDVHKKDLPAFPKVIGVATSPTGAAVRDIISNIKRRFPKVTIYLMPTQVQGEGSADSIVNSIKVLDNLPDVDVIIIGRGGGSLEDLWAFNEESVVRSIFSAKHPIISAVGHQTDYTLSDFTADRRAQTPSTAAELVVPDHLELLSEIGGYQDMLKHTMIGMLNQYKIEFQNLIDSYAFQRPYERVHEDLQQLDEYGERSKLAARNILRIKKLKFKEFDGKLRSLDPAAVISRGYSITVSTKESGKIINSISGLEANDEINIIVSNGEITGKVESTKQIDQPLEHLLSLKKRKKNN